jgi:cyclic pyranopterin phosphate synthase
MPKEIFGPNYSFLKKEEWLRFKELDQIVEAYTLLGVTKIRLTGGEPLLRPGLSKYIHGLKRFEKITDIAITTNGYLLEKKLSELKEAGLKRITVSLDAIDNEIFGKLNGRALSVDKVLDGIQAAKSEGFFVKINTVVQKGINDSQIIPLLEYFAPHSIPIRFIEFMDVGNHNGWKLDEVITAKEMISLIREKFDITPIDETSVDQVAKTYRYGKTGEFGLITSVSAPFCQNCTRARISADGKLFTCLFAHKGIDIKTYLRSEDYTFDGLLNLLSNNWRERDDRYSEIRTSLKEKSKSKVEMSYIGG